MDDMPETRIDQVTMIEGILTAAATGGSDDGPMYEALRRELLSDDRLKPLLPSFVRTYRNLGAFWPFIKGRAGTYAERRHIVSEAFNPLVDYLERRGRAPICKRILNELGLPHAEKDDLPKLYGAVAKALRLAPDQHVEEPIKAILGGAMNLVNKIGTLRNRFSDAHAPGGRMPVKPSERHAKLAVNTAGAVASFLVETYLDRAGAAKG